MRKLSKLQIGIGFSQGVEWILRGFYSKFEFELEKKKKRKEKG